MDGDQEHGNECVVCGHSGEAILVKRIVNKKSETIHEVLRCPKCGHTGTINLIRSMAELLEEVI